MTKKRNLPWLNKGDAAEALDTLNADLRRKPNATDVIRRTLEADLQKKSKRRRTNQAPASSAWKP
jgi:hypothetical protein